MTTANNTSQFAEFLTRRFVRFLQDKKIGTDNFDLNMSILKDVAEETRSHMADSAKLAGYTTYWIAKLRPVAAISNDFEKNRPNTHKYINELFAFDVAMAILFGSEENIGKTISWQDVPQKFWDSFFSNLRYKTASGDDLALMYCLLEAMAHPVEVCLEQEQKAPIKDIYGLAAYINEKDDITGKHCAMVAEYVRVLLDEIVASDLYQDELKDIDPEHVMLASMLHDIGKTYISQDILIKPGKLTPDEAILMKMHTNVGCNILDDFVAYGADTCMEYAKSMSLYHHEKWGGGGYPEGRAGKEIPLLARIIAIADAYDAIVSPRHYKKALPHEKAVEEISRNQCPGTGVTQFDPELIEVFLKVEAKFAQVNAESRNA